MESKSEESREKTTELSIPANELPTMETMAESPSHNVTGYFDIITGLEAYGWAYDKSNPAKKLLVELLDGERVVGVGEANIFRADLLNANIGDGKYSFKIRLPEDLCDGKEHSIVARDAETGTILGTKTFKYDSEYQGCVDGIDGISVIGWVIDLKDPNKHLIVELFEGDEFVVDGTANLPYENRGNHGFRLVLPDKLLDGRPHLFSVRLKNSEHLVGSIAVITPWMLTKESVLQEYVREGLKPRLSTVAGFRYESFTKAIEKIADEFVSPLVKLSSDSCGDKSYSAVKVGTSLVEQLYQLVHAHAQLVRGFSDADKTFRPLVFPEVENPLISIVIPIHNKFPVTYHCLCSLLLSANRASFEVIIVDDGSTDESVLIPDLIKGVQYIRNDEAKGFILSCNLGSSLARGEYIVILNNDTEVTYGWLDELLWPFEHFDNVGLTGPKLLYPDGTLQEAGGIVWNTGDPWNYGRRGNPHDPRYNYTRQVDYISGACIMIPRALWNELGGFDETFVPAYFEDTDLAFRVREKGYKTVYTPFSQVIHFEGISSGTSTASGIKRYQEINRPKFKKRWKKSVRENGEIGVDPDFNKDRNVEFRALVLDAETPMPDQNAGGYAAIQEMRMLQSLGFKCTFVPNNLAWMGHYTEALQRMGVECLYAPFVSSINEVIKKRGREFDIIYITRYYIAQHYIDLIRQHAPQAKIVMNNADLHFLRELRAAIMDRSGEKISQAVQTRDAELSTMRKVDLVLCYTDVEKAVILSHNLDSSRVAKCPWVVEVVSNVPGFDARADIAFLGGYNHPPNVEAVEWFAIKVMPLLCESLPGVKFRVYGSHVPKRLLTLAEKNNDIVIEGWVPNVDAVYNTCRIFIAPLQSGAGIKGKVIDALAHGVPCILSPIAAEGISYGNTTYALIADKPEEWVTAISLLYNNPKVWADMSQQALIFAQNQYSFAKGVAQMQDALQQVEIFTYTNHNTLFAH